MGFGDLAELSRMVARVYEGTTDPGAWPSILKDLSLFLGASKAALLTPTVGPEAGGFGFVHGMAQEDLDRNYREFPGEDAWVRRSVALGLIQMEGAVVLGEELLSHAELQETRWHRQFLSPLDIHHVLSSVIYGANHPAFPVLICSFYAGKAGGPFGLHAKESLGQVLPHLTRAIGLMLLLRDTDYRVAASLAAMERLDQGIVLVDRDGVLVHANPAAHRIFKARDGLILEPAPGRQGWLVGVGDPSARAVLSKALDGALGNRPENLVRFSRGILVPRPSGSEPYVVRVSDASRLRGLRPGQTRPGAILFLTDNAVPLLVDEALMEELYGLSRAESRLAAALSLGGTLEEAAWDLGVSLNTAKTQLKEVYAKTGAHSRAQLAKMALPMVKPQVPGFPRGLP